MFRHGNKTMKYVKNIRLLRPLNMPILDISNDQNMSMSKPPVDQVYTPLQATFHSELISQITLGADEPTCPNLSKT